METRSAQLCATDVPTKVCRVSTVRMNKLPVWQPLSIPSRTGRSPEEVADAKGWTRPISKPEMPQPASNISKEREDAQPAIRQPEILLGSLRVTADSSLRRACCIRGTRNHKSRLPLLLVKQSRARWLTSTSLRLDLSILRVGIDHGGPAT